MQMVKRLKMSLFPVEFDASQNLLPYQGCVNYYGQIMDAAEADAYLQRLLETIAWQNDLAVIFGKTIVTKRKVAWYADQAFSYTYSKTTKQALPWTPELLALKALVEAKTGETFNACLLNLYHSGEEGMAWHSDAERELKQHAAIASLSLGAERKFAFKHKQTNGKVELLLAHGSLLVMKHETQTYWLHRLPPTKKVQDIRVNLTFRMMNEPQ
jgi:alkylated DNA repair dioxygenase AlkB